MSTIILKIIFFVVFLWSQLLLRKLILSSPVWSKCLSTIAIISLRILLLNPWTIYLAISYSHKSRSILEKSHPVTCIIPLIIESIYTSFIKIQIVVCRVSLSIDSFLNKLSALTVQHAFLCNCISLFSCIPVSLLSLRNRISLLVSLYNIRREILFFLWLVVSSNSPLHTENFRYLCPLCPSRHHFLMQITEPSKHVIDLIWNLVHHAERVFHERASECSIKLFHHLRMNIFKSCIHRF